jgi:hypothetical protein
MESDELKNRYHFGKSVNRSRAFIYRAPSLRRLPEGASLWSEKLAPSVYVSVLKCHESQALRRVQKINARPRCLKGAVKTLSH